MCSGQRGLDNGKRRHGSALVVVKLGRGSGLVTAKGGVGSGLVIPNGGLVVAKGGLEVAW